ncbi:MAG: hypothetical protein ACFFCS_07650 [Candidatus Hodarchaeota archaeon]
MVDLKGYILVELLPHVNATEIVKYLYEKYLDGSEDYCCTIYGKYNLIVEKNSSELKDVDEILTKIRKDEFIKKNIAKTTTFLGIPLH